MSIEVACPQCSTRLKAPDRSAGRKVRCKKCNNSFRLPGEKPAGSDDTAVPSETVNPFDFAGGVETQAEDVQTPKDPMPAEPTPKDEFIPPPIQSGPPSMNPFRFGSAFAPSPPAEEKPPKPPRKKRSKRERQPQPIETTQPDEPKPQSRTVGSGSGTLIVMALLIMAAMILGIVIGGTGVYFLVK